MMRFIALCSAVIAAAYLPAMHAQFFAALRSRVVLTAGDEARIAEVLRSRSISRRALLLREGGRNTELSFVLSGALYSYSTDRRGIQQVIQFAFPGWWIADLSSLLTGDPSRLNIEALEDSELLQIRVNDHEALMNAVPAYERYIRILYQNAYVALQQRLGGTLGMSAADRYRHLMSQYPELLQHVPQHLVASYLGVTPETLSRIRRQLANRNLQ